MKKVFFAGFIGVTLWLAFWGTVIFVAVHFLTKYW